MVDETDVQIIEMLKKDGRESFVDMAKKLNLTEGAVRGRVKRLTTNGAIRKFTIETREGIKAIVMVSISGSIPTTHIASAIKRLPGVEMLYEVSGNYDIVCFVDTASTHETNSVVERIKKIEGVTDTVTFLVLK